MRLLRLLLVGSFILALLGVSGVGTAGAADEAPDNKWWEQDSEWLELEAIKQFHLERHEVIEEEYAEAISQLETRVGTGLRARVWRVFTAGFERIGVLPSGYVQSKRQEAIRRYRELDQERNAIPTYLKEISTNQLGIETMSADERQGRSARTELERWGIDLAKLGLRSKDILFTVTCTLTHKVQTDAKHVNAISGRGPVELVKAIENVHNGRGCLPDENYTTVLTIRADVPDSETITRKGSDYIKPRTAE